jgi:hypothetical protein
VRPTPEELAAWLAQPRKELTLAEMEAWLAQDDPIVPDEAKATCPHCNGWGNLHVGGPICPPCGGSGVVTIGEWRRILRVRISEGLS